LFYQCLDEEKVAYGKIIEELKTKHKMEIEKLNTVAKQKADDYANQEMIQIVAHHKEQFEKAREIVTLKNNLVRIHLLNVDFLPICFVNNSICFMK